MVAPDLPLAFTTRAYWLHAEQRDAEALRLVDAALKAEPGLTGALYLRGVIALAHGDYEHGLPLHELRLQRLGAMRYPARKLWDGKPTRASVRLWAEQGYGDTLMMLRYLPLVRKRCPNLSVEVQAPLVRLCRANGIDARPLGSDCRFDRHWPLMSLPYLAGALGVPCWVMLAVDCDWRWGRKARSPWYPEIRLFRQPTPGAWAPVIHDIKEALDARARTAAAA
jgi:hypothetical protein